MKRKEKKEKERRRLEGKQLLTNISQNQLHHSVVWQHLSHGPQTPTESGKDCGENHQDSTALPAEHLPPQSPQESSLHPQRPHPPSTWTVHTSALRPEVQKCEKQNHPTQDSTPSSQPPSDFETVEHYLLTYKPQLYFIFYSFAHCTFPLFKSIFLFLLYIISLRLYYYFVYLI